MRYSGAIAKREVFVTITANAATLVITANAATAEPHSDFDTLVEHALSLGLTVSVWINVRKSPGYGCPEIATRAALITNAETPGHMTHRAVHLLSMRTGTLPERLRECTTYRDSTTYTRDNLADLTADLDALPYTTEA